MSYVNFEKALELASNCDYYSVGCGKSEEIIEKAEELFENNFSEQTRDYLKRIGFLDFGIHEIFGIYKDDFSGIPHGCIIEGAIEDREKNGLPKKWMPIYDFGYDGLMAYLDYSQLNSENEPCVIEAYYNGKEYVVIEKIAEDLGDFILQLVKEQLDMQSS